MCKHSTSGQGLGGLGVLGWWLVSMILEVFSNLNDSVILHVLANASINISLKSSISRTGVAL